MAASAPAPGTSPTPPAPLPRIFITNLGLLLATGVAASAWILRYTDWFPEVGGVLALGGLFSWLAFVSNLLSKDTIEQLQGKFLALFSKPRVRLVLVTVSIALAVAACFFGAIRIEIQSTPQVHGFDVYREKGGGSRPSRDHSGRLFQYSGFHHFWQFAMEN